MVYPLYEAHRGDEALTEHGPLQHWPKVYESAPVEQKHEKIAELDAQLTAKRLELHELNVTRHEIARHETEDKKRLDKLAARSEVLTRLEDFLDGKITHYVKSSGWDWQDEIGREIVISEVAKEKCGDEANRRDLKLLSLFGRTNGNLAYGLNRYSDGSNMSSYSLIWPCCSMEEAQALAKEKVANQIASYRADPKKRCHMLNIIIANLKHQGMEVPEDLTAEQQERALVTKREALANAEAALEKARKAMSEA